MYDVTALGELLIDFTLTGADPAGYPAMQAHPGGAPGNVLAALSAYGQRTAMVGKVGADAFGELLLATLKSLDIDVSGVVSDPAVFTTLAFVTLDSRGERTFSFARKPGADACLRFSEVDINLIDNCRLLHFGSLSLTQEPAREATQMAVYRARRAGKLISFDPNLRPPLWESLDLARDQMLWGMGQANIVKLSQEEADFLWGCPPQQAAQEVHSLGPQVVFVTLGERGCYVSGNGFAAQVPALAGVEPVDATGAGDIFFGAALSRLLAGDKPLGDLTGEELTYAARFGCAAAGLSTQSLGGIASVPALDRVLERLT